MINNKKEEDWESQFQKWKSKKQNKDLENKQSSQSSTNTTPQTSSTTSTPTISNSQPQESKETNNKTDKQVESIEKNQDNNIQQQEVNNESNNRNNNIHQINKINKNISKKTKLILTIIAYLIPLIILLAILYYIFRPFLVGGIYSYNLEAGTEDDTNSLNSLYLKESKSLSSRIKYGELTYREIISTEPFSLIFKPPINIPSKLNLVSELEFIGKDSDIYFNNELVFPNLENYDLVKEFDDSYVYKKKNISLIKDLESKNPIDFIKKNYYGASVYSFIQSDIVYPIIEDYVKKDTHINNRFRGGLDLIVYTENGLNLEFSKKNLSSYSGGSNYFLIIKNTDDEVIYNQTLEEPKLYTINIPNITGIFYILFTPIGIRISDGIITNISINTNKVLISGEFLSLNPITLFFDIGFDKEFTFFYWHKNLDQKVTIVSELGNKTVLYIGKEFRGKDYVKLIPAGKNYITLEKGDIIIKNSLVYSPNKENWFYYPFILEEKLKNPDLIILDKEFLTIKKDNVKLIKNLEMNNGGANLSIKVSKGNKIKFKGAELILV